MANDISIIIRAIDEATSPLRQIWSELNNFAEKNREAFSKMAIAGWLVFTWLSYNIKQWIDAMIEYESITTRLSHILKTATGATDEQVNSLIQQAHALELVWVASKESIIQAQAQLSTFDLKAETIERLIPSIVDYVIAEKGATATTADFQERTNSLAQALNWNFASLSRVWFMLDENTKEMIANGTEMERAEALAKVLDSTYWWFNETVAKTSEWIKILREREFWSLQENIAKWLYPIFIQINEVIFKLLQKINTWIWENPELTNSIIKITLAWSWLALVLWTLWLLLPKIIAWFVAIRTALIVLWWPIWWIIWAIWLLTLAWKNWLSNTLDMIKDFSISFTKWFLIAFEKVSEFLINFAWFFLRTIWKLWVWVVAFSMDFVEFMYKAIYRVWENFWSLIFNITQYFKSIDWAGAWSWMQEWFWNVLNNVINNAKKIWRSIANFFKNIFAWKDANIDVWVELWKLSSWQKEAILKEYNSIFDGENFTRTKSVLNSIADDFVDTFIWWVGEVKSELWELSITAWNSLDEINFKSFELSSSFDDINLNVNELWENLEENLWKKGGWSAKKLDDNLKLFNNQVELTKKQATDLRESLVKWLEWAKDKVFSLIDWFNQMKEKLNEMKEKGISQIEKLWEQYQKLKEKGINEINKLWDEFEKLKEKGINEINKLWDQFIKLKEKGEQEIQKLKNQIDWLVESINNIEAKWFNDIANRALDIWKELESINKELEKEDLAIEKQNELLAKQIKLNEELNLAKKNITEEDIQKAQEERDKSSTQKILDRMQKDKEAAQLKINQIEIEIAKREEAHQLELENKKIEIEQKIEEHNIILENKKIEIEQKKEAHKIELMQFKEKAEEVKKNIMQEIQDYKNMMAIKKNEIESEKEVYYNLVQTKKDLDKEYFSLFWEQIKKQLTQIEKVKLSMQEVRSFNDNNITWQRAFGWPVNANKSYLVWERWPEIFTPGSSWNITNTWWWQPIININMWWVVVNNEADENRLIQKLKNVLVRETKLYNLWIN